MLKELQKSDWLRMLDLSEREIPLEASILAVADAYEAMTSDRVYRASIGAEAARQQLIENSGTQFNTKVAEALLRAIAKREPSGLKV